MRDAVIVAATRTAIGTFQGGLSSLPATTLGATVIKALLDKTGVGVDAIDEVIMGNVLTGGTGQNPARQAAVNAGLAVTTPSMTINKVCASGLKAVQLAAQSVMLGQADIVIAGGMESMSRAAYVLPGMRTGQRMGHGSVIDTMISDGLWDAFNDYHMGITAENLARRHQITREDQDAYSAESQRRAAAAMAANLFADEITPVMVPQRKGDALAFATDEQPRADTTAASLAKLRPAFDKAGSVTAGNSSSLNDGAAAILVMSAERAKALNLPILGRIAAAASAGVDPAYMGEGPIPATQRCLRNADWSLDSVGLIEANEAFAVQSLTVMRQLGLDPAKVNVNGGAIALGHPIGASGCRILVTLLHNMARQNVKRGLATLCVGGGQGVTLAIER